VRFDLCSSAFLKKFTGDNFLDGCLGSFIERDIFFKVDKDDIINIYIHSKASNKIVRKIAW
jgi:hypothetical protein